MNFLSILTFYILFDIKQMEYMDNKKEKNNIYIYIIIKLSIFKTIVINIAQKNTEKSLKKLYLKAFFYSVVNSYTSLSMIL